MYPYRIFYYYKTRDYFDNNYVEKKKFQISCHKNQK